MEFRGSRVPKVKTAVTEAIKDLNESCVDEGATDLELPTRALTYSSLIAKLKDLGLIPPPPPPPEVVQQGPAPARVEQVEQQQQLLFLDSHRTEVLYIF